MNLTNNSSIPTHVAIIMDGNGRWAKSLGKNRVFGHRNGVNSVQDIVETAAKKNIKYLTLYAFSTENWGRPKKEIGILMDLLVSSLKKELTKMIENNIRLNTIGDISMLPPKVENELIDTIDKTKAISPENVDETIINEHLYTQNLPAVDLLIRTSGEQRISNFLLWQIAYAELYFSEVLWPDFTHVHFQQAIESYQKRERRFGKTSEQLIP